MKKLEKAKEVYEAIKVPNELNYVVNKAILDKKTIMYFFNIINNK